MSLKVYDVQGREVATVVDGKMAAGEQTIEFDMTKLPAGIYFYRLTATGQRLTANGDSRLRGNGRPTTNTGKIVKL